MTPVETIATDERGAERIILPCADVEVVARLGPAIDGGADIYVMGARRAVRRKLVRSDVTVVSTRLRLGTATAVFGVGAATLAECIVPLDALWSAAQVGEVVTRLASARTQSEAAGALADVIERRSAGAARTGAAAPLVEAAVVRLGCATVKDVANDLGVSERHLRRVFHDIVGVTPKAFARQMRFERALRAARQRERADWASVALAAGYYDQAHLAGDFRSIAGASPGAFLREVRAASNLGRPLG